MEDLLKKILNEQEKTNKFLELLVRIFQEEKENYHELVKDDTNIVIPK